MTESEAASCFFSIRYFGQKSLYDTGNVKRKAKRHNYKYLACKIVHKHEKKHVKLFISYILSVAFIVANGYNVSKRG